MLPFVSVITTTINDLEKAQALARRVIDAKAAGCVQIEGPMQSLYCWEGKICDDREYRVTMKTLPDRAEDLMYKIVLWHPYQVPELLVDKLKCTNGYYDWLAEQVSPESDPNLE